MTLDHAWNKRALIFADARSTATRSEIAIERSKICMTRSNQLRIDATNAGSVTEQDLIWVNAIKAKIESDRNRHASMVLLLDSDTMYEKGNAMWQQSVKESGLTMEWDGAACKLSNGETYHDTTRA